jgi:hypothetical protein
MARKMTLIGDDSSPDRLMLAYLCIKDTTGLVDQVAILDRFGLRDAQIALVCNCAEQSVRASRLKRKNRARPKLSVGRQPEADTMIESETEQ